MPTRLSLHGGRNAASPSAAAPRRLRPVDGSPSRPAPRRSTDSLAQLTRLSGRLDQLLQRVSVGARHQREHDEIVNEAEAIADDLRAVFRAPSPARAGNVGQVIINVEPRPVHPPLHIGPGKAWF